MANITTCSPPNARSWTALSSIITPTRAIDAHCKIETGHTRRRVDRVTKRLAVQKPTCAGRNDPRSRRKEGSGHNVEGRRRLNYAVKRFVQKLAYQPKRAQGRAYCIFSSER